MHLFWNGGYFWVCYLFWFLLFFVLFTEKNLHHYLPGNNNRDTDNCFSHDSALSWYESTICRSWVLTFKLTVRIVPESCRFMTSYLSLPCCVSPPLLPWSSCGTERFQDQFGQGRKFWSRQSPWNDSICVRLRNVVQNGIERKFMIRDSWHVTCDPCHVTCDMRLVTFFRSRSSHMETDEAPLNQEIFFAFD